MGLNRTETAYDRGKFFLDGHDVIKSGNQPGTQSGTHSSQVFESSKSDEWRALAGCFYLTSVYVPLIL